MPQVLDPPTQRKLALNQVLFREVNEQIRSLTPSADESGLELVCECSHDACKKRLPIEVTAYEAVRRFPTRFVVAPGHEIYGVERVVESNRDYNVVEKIEAAAPVAIRLDPRAQGLRGAA